MTDIIIIAVVALVVALALVYIIKVKKSGKKCIGCPSACNCPSANKGGCSCQSDEE